VSAIPATPPKAGGDEEGPARQRRLDYERFVRAVVLQQLREWLPSRRSCVLDISRVDPARASSPVSATIARAGHHVIRVENPTCPDRRANRSPAPDWAVEGVSRVFGDTRALDWFRSERLDAIVAEGSALSSCLATETTVAQAARLLKPGGSLLLTVDSMLYGLAQLAEQHRWQELADASTADVVLIPAEGDDYTRCFGPEELCELVADAGFDVDWVRPRTVIPPDVVGHALANDPAVFDELVASEVRLAVERQGEALGKYLTLSASRRA
jgi:hypothetical protein